MNWYKIAGKEPWQMTQQEFIDYHKTGFISSEAYKDYTSGDSFEWASKEKYPVLVYEGDFGGYHVEFRQSGTKTQYVKTGQDGDIVRDEKGLALYLSDEEKRNLGLSLTDTTIFVFIGDDCIGHASDEWGADGIWVKQKYQKLGIGTKLTSMFRNQFRKERKMGQMTYEGSELAKKYHRNLVMEALERGEDVPAEVLKDYKEKNVVKEILSCVPKILQLVQSEYDAWSQDEEGFDEEFGTGGICDRISEIIGDVVSENGFDIAEGGQEGDDHAYIIAMKDGRSFSVDIPPSVYETGGGYSWIKKEGVVFSPNDVEIYSVDIENFDKEAFNAGFEKIAQSKEPWEMTFEEYSKIPETVVNTTMPLSILKDLNGTNNEQKYVRNTARYRDMLARMKQYGFEGNIIDSPDVILRRTADGELKIEDGNHRIAAAYDAGIKEIPVKIIETPFHSDIISWAIENGKDVPEEAKKKPKLFAFNLGLKKVSQLKSSISSVEEQYPKDSSSLTFELINNVPNESSIDGEASDFVVLDGIRAVKLSLFDMPPVRNKETLDLAKEIKTSGKLNVLIVGVDYLGPDKPYIIEGSHRYDALKIIAEEGIDIVFPAIIVVNNDDETYY